MTSMIGLEVEEPDDADSKNDSHDEEERVSIRTLLGRFNRLHNSGDNEACVAEIEVFLAVHSQLIGTPELIDLLFDTWLSELKSPASGVVDGGSSSTSNHLAATNEYYTQFLVTWIRFDERLLAFLPVVRSRLYKLASVLTVLSRIMERVEGAIGEATANADEVGSFAVVSQSQESLDDREDAWRRFQSLDPHVAAWAVELAHQHFIGKIRPWDI
ncbi:MAG: hypothetical protein K2Q09_02415, partial [Phycisphaerales bacterium]|nr:hypothetical protein [Phycisphaerales bacterium]